MRIRSRRPSGLRTGGGAILILCLLAGSGHARQAQQPPVFRAGVDVVQLDVTVLDKNRQPVKGLSQADFTVLEDGKPQSIVAFDAVNIENPPPPPVAWMRDVTPDVTTNSLAETRLFALVIDDACIPQDPRFIKNAKQAVRQFIDKLGPDDLTAVIFTADNRKTQDFTNDRTKLLATLDKFSPGMAQYQVPPDPRIVPKPPLRPEPPSDAYFFQSSVSTLASVADYLIAIPHRRKSMIWISPGIPVDFEKVAAPILTTVEPGAAPPLLAREEMRSLMTETDRVFQRAQKANVAIYPIDPTGMGGLDEFIGRQNGEGVFTGGNATKTAARSLDFLQMTAENTGGHAIVNTDDYTKGLDQIFVENSSYYLVGFQSSNPKAGSLRRLEVKVNRPDVEVHSRSRYETPAVEKPSKQPPLTPLGKAITGLLPLGELPMQVALAPFAVPGKREAAVAIVLKVSQPIPPEAAKGRVTLQTDVLTSAFTPAGDARGSRKHTARIQLRPGADGEARYELLSRIDLAPGRYRLRLAAYNESSSKTGSVFADVVVPNFADDAFSMSGVAVNMNPSRPSAPKDALSSVLPFMPTAEREFLAGDAVRAFVQLYQNGKRALEPARVTMKIIDNRNRTLVDETQSIGVDRFKGVEAPAALPDRRPPTAGRGVLPPESPAASPFANASMRTADITYPIAFGTLAPGPYLLTIEATVGATQIRRDVRFTIQ